MHGQRLQPAGLYGLQTADNISKFVGNRKKSDTEGMVPPTHFYVYTKATCVDTKSKIVPTTFPYVYLANASTSSIHHITPVYNEQPKIVSTHPIYVFDTTEQRLALS